MRQRTAPSPPPNIFLATSRQMINFRAMADVDDRMAEQANNKKRMLDALDESHGIITRACQIAKVGRTTFYEWLDSDPEFKASYEAVNDSAIDFVESKLFEKISGIDLVTGYDKDSGDPIVYTQPPSDTAIIFYLKCRAKKRGYVERTELTGADGQPLEVKVITGMTIT